MFSHIILGARDLERQTAFYDAVLPHLGLIRRTAEDDGGPAGSLWTEPDREWPQFWVQLPYDGRPATWGNGVQVSLRAPSRAAVDAAWAAAIEEGGHDEGRPGLRPDYYPDYYGAYVRDPEGNKLCFLHMSAFTDQSAQLQPSDASLRPDQESEYERGAKNGRE